MVNLIKNRWFDPHVKKKLKTWKGQIKQNFTPEQYIQLSVENGIDDTVNPFATNSLLDVERGDSYVCIIDCLPDTWNFILRPDSGEIIHNGQSDGLWIIKQDVGQSDTYLYHPYATGVAGKPMTIKGLAVYSIDVWNVLKPLAESNKIPYVIDYSAMPISIN